MKNLILDIKNKTFTEILPYLVGAYDFISFDFDAVCNFFKGLYQLFELTVSAIL